MTAARLGIPGGASARQTAEDGAFHQAGAAGIIIEERTVSDFSGREKPADHVAAGILNLALFGDAAAAERKRGAAGHRESVIRRDVQSLRPVRLRRADAARAFSVVLRRIERRIVDSFIKLVDGFDDISAIQARQFFRAGTGTDSIFAASSSVSSGSIGRRRPNCCR